MKITKVISQISPKDFDGCLEMSVPFTVHKRVSYEGWGAGDE